MPILLDRSPRPSSLRRFPLSGCPFGFGGEGAALGRNPRPHPRLDRIQVIKGWLENGETFERIYDVAWSGDRVPDEAGRVEAVPDTVDRETGRYSNAFGATTRSARWTDPDFDPDRSSFYYMRVLEIPTPRHSTLDAIALGRDVDTTGYPLSIQERAYSSPIHYRP